MDHRKLGLRVYATAADYPTAFGLAERLIADLPAAITARECRVYPYWKFDDQFGIWLDLSGPDQAAGFEELTRLLAPEWQTQGVPGDRSVIWNQPTHGGVAILPEATWMHLELWGEEP